MRPAVLLFCGLMLGQFARADDLAKEQLFNMWARDFTQKLQGKVLPGWIVTYEENDHIINFTREQPAVCYDAKSNRDESAHFKIVYWKFSMKVMPFISQKGSREVEKQSMQQELAAKKKQLAILQDRVKKTKALRIEDLKGVSIEEPDLPALEREIRKLENDITQIPDGYYKDLSLSWITSYPDWKDGWAPRDDYVRRECEVVFKQADAVLSKY